MVLPELLLCVVTFADRLVIFELLKHHRTAAGGGAIMGLGGAQGTMSGEAAGKKTHQASATLFAHSHYLWQSVEITRHQFTAKPADQVNTSRPQSYCYLHQMRS